MKAVVLILGFALALWVPLRGAEAQDYQALLRDFHASALTRADKRFLQTALAFEGDYLGLLDGDWGPRSQIALDGYARREFGGPAQDWHMAMLALDYFQRIERDGWKIEYFEPLGLSILFPVKTAVVDPATESFINWRHLSSSLRYSVAVADVDKTSRFHEFTFGTHSRTGAEAPYTVRRNGFAVTKARSANGAVLYTRSNLIGRLWSTVMLSAEAKDEATLNAVAASISVGRTEEVMFSRDGRLADAVFNLLALLENSDPQTATRSGTAETSDAETPSAGSGFFVSETGHVLTNAHVVKGCTNVTVDGRPARILNSSAEFDLALLQATYSQGNEVALFSAYPARLNSDVTVAGYPYAGVLGGLNITRGAVSSTLGLGGEGTNMQITAPVQSGNSGGPVIAASGQVVGVVVAKLDALRVADAVGDVPQNVNFAIRGEIAKLFLFQNGIEPRLGSDDVTLAPVELAERASRFTVFIECR